VILILCIPFHDSWFNPCTSSCSQSLALCSWCGLAFSHGRRDVSWFSFLNICAVLGFRYFSVFLHFSIFFELCSLFVPFRPPLTSPPARFVAVVDGSHLRIRVWLPPPFLAFGSGRCRHGVVAYAPPPAYVAAPPFLFSLIQKERTKKKQVPCPRGRFRLRRL
jgi:hypothetical protein